MITSGTLKVTEPEEQATPTLAHSSGKNQEMMLSSAASELAFLTFHRHDYAPHDAEASSSRERHTGEVRLPTHSANEGAAHELPFLRLASFSSSAGGSAQEDQPTRKYWDGEITCTRMWNEESSFSYVGCVRIASGYFDNEMESWCYCFIALGSDYRAKLGHLSKSAIDIDRQEWDEGQPVQSDGLGMIDLRTESDFIEPKLHAGDQGTVFFTGGGVLRCMIRRAHVMILCDSSINTEYELVTEDGHAEVFQDDCIMKGAERFDKNTGEIVLPDDTFEHWWSSLLRQVKFGVRMDDVAEQGGV